VSQVNVGGKVTIVLPPPSSGIGANRTLVNTAGYTLPALAESRLPGSDDTLVSATINTPGALPVQARSSTATLASWCSTPHLAHQPLTATMYNPVFTDAVSSKLRVDGAASPAPLA